MRPLQYKLTTIVLGFIFTSFSSSFNILFIGIKKNAPVLIISGISIIILSSVSLDILFFIGCSFYKLTKRILQNWKHLTLKDAYLKRLVLSLQIMAMPAGDVGIIDVYIKINYLEKLLRTVVDSIITVQSVTVTVIFCFLIMNVCYYELQKRIRNTT